MTWTQIMAWTGIMGILTLGVIELAEMNAALHVISASLVDKGRMGGPLQRIDHNLAIIGDYGIPAQAPNAPRTVR